MRSLTNLSHADVRRIVAEQFSSRQFGARRPAPSVPEVYAAVRGRSVLLSLSPPATVPRTVPPTAAKKQPAAMTTTAIERILKQQHGSQYRNRGV